MDKSRLMGKRVAVSREFRRTGYPNKTYHEQLASFTGWIVGFRTIQNGYCEWWGESEGTIWKPVGYIKCVLVAKSPHQRGAKVPIDAFELIDDEG